MFNGIGQSNGILGDLPNEVPFFGLKFNRGTLYQAGTISEVVGFIFQSIAMVKNDNAYQVGGRFTMSCGIIIIAALEGYLILGSESVEWDRKKITALAVRILGESALLTGFAVTSYGMSNGDRTVQVIGMCLSAAGILISQIGTVLILKT